MHEKIIIISTILYVTDSLKTLITSDSASPFQGREKVGVLKGLFAVLNAMYTTISHGQTWTDSPKDLVSWMLVYAKDLSESLDPSSRPVFKVN